MSSTLALADAADLARAWPLVLPPMLTYLAAADWTPPAEAGAAAAWLLDGPRLAFCRELDGAPVVSVLERHRGSAMCRLLVVSPRGAEVAGIGEVAGDLVRYAVHDLGMRRCEWRLLAGWSLARAAAAELGFQEEGCLPEACFVAGRYEDVVLTGLLAAEARVGR